MRREPLALEGEAVGVLPVGAAVDEEDRGNFVTWLVVERLGEEAVDFGAVFAVGGEVFGGDEVELGEEGVVDLG